MQMKPNAAFLNGAIIFTGETYEHKGLVLAPGLVSSLYSHV